MKFGLSDQTLKQLQSIFRSHPQIKKVKLFGSRAIGTYKKNSDIDLVLWGNIDEKLLATIAQELDELPLPYLFDVITYSRLSLAPLKKHIQLCAKVLYRQKNKDHSALNTFTFRALAFSDIPLMHHWFNLPHVQKFYSLRSWTEEEVLAKLKPYILGEKPILGFIVLADENPIAYIQMCNLSYNPWPNQNFSENIIRNGTGVDIFIGDKSMIGKGLGGRIMQEFLEKKVWPDFQYCVVDPDVKNSAAIRCYEKLNFKEHTLIETVDALNRPVTLKLMLLKRNFKH